MSVIDGLAAAYLGVSDLIKPQGWVYDTLGGISTEAGESVSVDRASNLAAYFLGVRAISEDVGKLPLHVYKRLEPRGREKARGHAFYRLLHSRANADCSAMAFRETVTSHAISWGNGFGEIVWTKGGDVEGLWVIHPSRVQIMRDDADRLFYRIHNDDGRSVDRQPWQMLHIHGLGDDGVQGYSVVQKAKESLGMSLAAELFGARFFGHGINSRVVLFSAEELNDEARVRLREGWNRAYGGKAGQHRTAVLEGDIKMEKLTIPPEDAQFLETRRFQVEEIARWLRMPPHKLMHLTSPRHANLEQQSIEYVQDGLTGWLQRWEDEIQEKLFERTGDREHYAEHNTLGMLRGDSEARSKLYRERYFTSSLSPNDIREMENENPIEGGDTYFVPVNMQPMELALNPPAPAPAPAVAAKAKEPSGGMRPGERKQAAAAQVPVAEAARVIATDAARRILRKEENAVGRAAKRYGGRGEAFGAWVDKFYGEHAEFMGDVLEPFSVLTEGRLTAGADVREVVAEYIARSSRECLAGDAAWERWVDRAQAELIEALTEKIDG